MRGAHVLLTDRGRDCAATVDLVSKERAVEDSTQSILSDDKASLGMCARRRHVDSYALYCRASLRSHGPSIPPSHVDNMMMIDSSQGCRPVGSTISLLSLSFTAVLIKGILGVATQRRQRLSSACRL